MKKQKQPPGFRQIEVGKALTPHSFHCVCDCGQVIFEIAGINLGFNINEGMDLIAKCACGREHSIADQIEQQKQVQEAAQNQSETAQGSEEVAQEEKQQPNRAARRKTAKK